MQLSPIPDCFELPGSKLPALYNLQLICQGYNNKSVSYYETEKPQTVHTLGEIAFIILLNFPIMFVVKKVNKATAEIMYNNNNNNNAYFMWLSEYKINL